MIKHKDITTEHIQNLIDYITEHKDDYDFYAVNVHGVGFEWRIIVKDKDSKLLYWISIEAILGRTYTLFVATDNLFDKNNQQWCITEEQFNLLDKVITKYWKNTGEKFQDRGLY